MTYIISLIIIFMCKVCDIALSTAKSILLQDGKNFLSALLNAISQIFFLLIVSQIAKNSNNTVSILIVAFASFLGSYVVSYLFDKTKKDSVWKFTITPTNSQQGKLIADMLREHNIAVKTSKVYTQRHEQVLDIEAFATCKNESKRIVGLLPDNVKYHIIETINKVD